MRTFIKGLTSLIILLFFILNLSCISQTSFFNKGGVDKKHDKIAGLPFRDYNRNEGNNSGELARNVFESTLVRKGFNVIEVEKTAVVVDFDFLEKNEFPSKWITETGSAIGADYMLYGSVHDYRTYQSTTSFLYIFSWLEITSSVGITARLVSCKTGEVVWSGALTRASYTFNDAAVESIGDLVRTIKIRPVDSK
jgi:TolB-like protein